MRGTTGGAQVFTRQGYRKRYTRRWFCSSDTFWTVEVIRLDVPSAPQELHHPQLTHATAGVYSKAAHTCMTSRLIRSGLPDRLLRRSPGQSGVLLSSRRSDNLSSASHQDPINLRHKLRCIVGKHIVSFTIAGKGGENPWKVVPKSSP